MAQQSDFPEVSEFLQKMQIRKSLFGYEKEDVLIKMQQLNRLYQDRLLVLKGQMEQEKKAAKAESERIRQEAQEQADLLRDLARTEAEQLKQEALQLQQEARQEAEKIQREMQEQHDQLVEQIRKEEREKILADLKEQQALHQKELALLGEELGRASEQMQRLKSHVAQMTESLEHK